jgi:LPS-assembly lipoprotein
MSLFDRRAFLCLPLALAACGFEPVYGSGGTGQRLQNQTRVNEPVSRNDYLVTRRLEERLGRSGSPTYALNVSARYGETGLAVDPAGNTERYNLVGLAEYSLIEYETGRVVTSGAVDNFTSYSATGTTIATRAAQRDAQERLMILLADQVVIRLLSADLS